MAPIIAVSRELYQLNLLLVLCPFGGSQEWFTNIERHNYPMTIFFSGKSLLNACYCARHFLCGKEIKYFNGY